MKWLTYALLAAICWGVYIFASKLVSSPEYGRVSPRWSSLTMLVGINLCCLLYFFLTPADPPPSLQAGLLGTVPGLLWMLGMLFATFALAAGAPVSRLVPIYNTNTLVAVALSLLLLHEARSAANYTNILTGTILMVIGGIIVSR